MSSGERRIVASAEAKTTTNIDQNGFKMTFNVKGFPKENVKVQLKGRVVTIDAQFHEEHRFTPQNPDVLSGTVKELQQQQRQERQQQQQQGQEVEVEHEEEVGGFQSMDHKFHQSATIPENVDLKSVKIDVDEKTGLVTVTGKVAVPNMGPGPA